MHITIACMKVKVWLPSNLQVEAAHTKLRMILSMPAQQRSTDPSCSHMKSDTSSRLTRAYLNHYVQIHTFIYVYIYIYTSECIHEERPEQEADEGVPESLCIDTYIYICIYIHIYIRMYT